MSYILWYIAGIITGSVVTYFMNGRIKTFGTLRIDETDPENVKMRIELDDIDLSKESKIVLFVDSSANLSQK